MMIRIFLTALLLMASASIATAIEEVDLEIVFLADASSSIDDKEILFQRQGYVDALASSDILQAIQSGLLGRIAVTYVEWGQVDSQVRVIPWKVVHDRASAEEFGRELMRAPRLAFGRNAIGNAISYAQREIESNRFKGIRKVIDFSGDSAYTWGGIPTQFARQSALDSGIVINALAILCRECVSGRPTSQNLEEAYANQIIGGPGSFVVTADGMDQFAEAVRKKLILEIADSFTGGQKIVRVTENLHSDPGK